ELERYQGDDARTRPAAAARNRLTGLGASPGFAIGRAHRLEPPVRFEQAPARRIGTVREEITRFRGAVRRAIEQTAVFRERVRETLPEMDATIFDAHRLMLEDATMLH